MSGEHYTTFSSLSSSGVALRARTKRTRPEYGAWHGRGLFTLLTVWFTRSETGCRASKENVIVQPHSLLVPFRIARLALTQQHLFESRLTVGMSGSLIILFHLILPFWMIDRLHWHDSARATAQQLWLAFDPVRALRCADDRQQLLVFRGAILSLSRR